MLNVVFSHFKTGDLLSSKDFIKWSEVLHCINLCAVYQFCDIRETKRHLPTRFNEHLVTDKKSPIFKRLLESKPYKSLYDENCFAIIDFASSSFRLKLKEVLHIK